MSRYPDIYNKFAIIPHPTGAKALCICRNGSWTLPGLTNPEYDLHVQYVGAFNDAIADQYGVDATTLDYFDYVETFLEGRREIDRFYAMENLAIQIVCRPGANGSNGQILIRWD